MKVSMPHGFYSMKSLIMWRPWIYVLFACYGAYAFTADFSKAFQDIQDDEKAVAQERLSRFFLMELVVLIAFVLELAFLVCSVELVMLNVGNIDINGAHILKCFTVALSFYYVFKLYLDWCRFLEMVFRTSSNAELGVNRNLTFSKCPS